MNFSKTGYIVFIIGFTLLSSYLCFDYIRQKRTFENGKEELVRIDKRDCYGSGKRKYGFVSILFRGEVRELNVGYYDCLEFEEGIYLRIFYDKEKDYIAYKRPPKVRLYFAIGSFFIPLYALWYFIKLLRKV